MEAWYSAVRNLKDDAEDPKSVRQLCFRVYGDLSNVRKLKSLRPCPERVLKSLRPCPERVLKSRKEFRERKGAEFDHWTSQLEEEYPREMISAVLGDDTFWNTTLLRCWSQA